MKHRISVGAFVIHNNKILVVNHRRAERYNFWVAPGGGIQGTETLEEAVIREVKEETGVKVSVDRLLYIEEMYEPEMRYVKFWFRCEFINGQLDCSAQEAVCEHIVDVRFMGQDDLKNYTVFPQVLNDACFEEIASNNNPPKFIALRKMEVY